MSDNSARVLKIASWTLIALTSLWAVIALAVDWHVIGAVAYGVLVGAALICFETRRQKGQTYSAFLGFFRQFTLISVVSDERDLVRVRTNYRHGEDLYLYHTTATPEFAQSLFLNYTGMTNELHDHPQWYNAVTHNCTTEIYTLKSMKDQPLDWRILLNGKADEMAYQRGMIATGGLPFKELKQRAWINPAARAANDDPDFSQRIRENRPGF